MTVEAIPYQKPRRVWVKDEHVIVENQNMSTFIMTAEVAIEVARQVGAAGDEALINKVLNRKNAS